MKPAYVGELNSDHYDEEAQNLLIHCPRCQRKRFPFRSRTWELISESRRWVGLDYQEPVQYYQAQCRCGLRYLFTLYFPQ